MFFGGDPFEHFAHAGMGGGGGGGRRGGGGGRASADVDTTKLYETLGVRTLKLLNIFFFLPFQRFIFLNIYLHIIG